MKVLQIINSLATGGAEKLLLETLPLFRKKSIPMDILVLNGTDYPFMKQLKSLNCCRVYSLGFKSVYNPIHILKIIPYLRKYDIIHVHLFPTQYWVVLAKLVSFSKVKLVFTEHNTSNRRIENKFSRYCDRFIYSRYYKIVCITNEVKVILKNHTRLSINKFIVIENGINLETLRNANYYIKKDMHLKISKTDKIIIQVAGFREQKDHPTLIKSLQYLPCNVKLLLVGDGILRKNCEDLVQELKLQDRIIFLGLRMDIPQLLKTADIVVLSSKYEGLSLSSIEGMASGKPFIASNVPGLTEVVAGAGILFVQGNAKELAVAIKKLLTDNNYYQSVANACQERAEQYSIKVMIEKYIKMYESIS
jgi:glycosyltransferase involved in cell wall biosynthesis